MATINMILNGQPVEVPAGITILEAARQNGIYIPTLCNHPDQRVKANCRVCVVEVAGSAKLQTACSTLACEGMEVTTNSSKVRETVRTIVELILADHPQECLTCIRGGNCELRKLAVRYSIQEMRSVPVRKNLPLDLSTHSMVRDMNKCIKCGRCAEACHHTQEVGILMSNHRGLDVLVSPQYDRELGEVGCVRCGQCALVCPVGAIHEKDDTEKVWDALADSSKHVVVQFAPSVRVSIAEEFGQPAGQVSTGQLVTALRKLGFDKVFDTDFTADLTIMEEGHELLSRIQNGGTLPLLTSCSPGWINYIERYYPGQLDHVSSCKSPQQMFGAIAKSYYAEKAGIDPQDIYVVSVMPCVAKKHECARAEMNDSGYQDVDVVLTVRELGRMLHSEGIDFNLLEEGVCDDPLGESTGAAVIFGATGGVMEAALRTVYEVVTGKELAKLEFEDVRGMEGIKSAVVDLDGTKVKVGVAHSLANAKKIMEQIKNGESDFAFIEVMCCPGGCIGGGGQPYSTTNDIRRQRIDALYTADADLPLRKSHENPQITKLYEEYLGAPLGSKSHHLLHTTYASTSDYLPD